MTDSRQAIAWLLWLVLLLPGLTLATTADHSRFKELQGPFASGEEVTRTRGMCCTPAG